MRGQIRIGFASALLCAIAACSSPPPNRPDFDHGLWHGQSINPPDGLLTDSRGVLIGRIVHNAAGATPPRIEYTLVDPYTADPRYAITSSMRSAEYIVIPISALTITAHSIQLDATDDTPDALPHTTLLELENRYPRTTMTPYAVSPLTMAPALKY